MKRVALAASMAGAVILAGCSQASGTTPSPAPTVTVTMTATATVTATPKPPPAPDKPLAMGKTAKTSNLSLQVSKYKVVDEVGTKVGALLVKACVLDTPPGESTLTFGIGPWTLIGPDSERYRSTDITGDPSLEPSYPVGMETDPGYKVGECVKGWIPFNSNGDKVALARYTNGDGETVEWSL